jgi:hypothetical protein
MLRRIYVHTFKWFYTCLKILRHELQALLLIRRKSRCGLPSPLKIHLLGRLWIVILVFSGKYNNHCTTEAIFDFFVAVLACSKMLFYAIITSYVAYFAIIRTASQTAYYSGDLKAADFLTILLHEGDHIQAVRLRLWTAVTNGHTVHPPGDIRAWRTMVELYRQGKTHD